MNFTPRPKIKSKLLRIIVEATSVAITVLVIFNVSLGVNQVISFVIPNIVLPPLNKFFCHFFQDFVT